LVRREEAECKEWRVKGRIYVVNAIGIRSACHIHIGGYSYKKSCHLFSALTKKKELASLEEMEDRPPPIEAAIAATNSGSSSYFLNRLRS
jgi:hypothetical protein